MPYPFQLPKLAENLIREHLLIQVLFENITTDEQFANLPEGTMDDFRIHETAFLDAARQTGEKLFSIDYYGQLYLITADDAYDAVAIRIVVMLEAA